VEGGGPAGTLPPHNFKVLFKEGGIGTFYPLYYTLVDRTRKAEAAAAAAAAAQQLPPAGVAPNAQVVQELVHKA
jgi:hypothetical protein